MHNCLLVLEKVLEKERVPHSVDLTVDNLLDKLDQAATFYLVVGCFVEKFVERVYEGGYESWVAKDGVGFDHLFIFELQEN